MSTTSDIAAMERGIQQLLLGITDKDKRRTISRKITTYLKGKYRENLKNQTDIEGKAFASRAPIRSHKPHRLKQEKRKLLINFAKASSLRAKYNTDMLRVGYSGMAGKVARFQNEGNIQQRKGYFIETPARQFAGIGDDYWEDIEMIISEEL